MKSKVKLTIIILITLGIFFATVLMITVNQSFITGNNNDTNFDKENPKISAVSGKIHIDNNWTDAWSAGICTGNGTYSAPYVIEDLVIDAGGSGSGILIENSIVYFKIENCTLYGTDSGPRWGAGILLSNVNNSQLIGNNFSSNYCAIYLFYNNYNNTITGNIVNNNGGGIYFAESYNNTISGNTINNNIWCGIYLAWSSNNTISGNIVCNNSAAGMYSSGIYFDDCHYNTISGNTLNNNIQGITFDGSNYNTITGNTANNNEYGIFLYVSSYNTISGNVLIGNDECIVEFNCQGNVIQDNDCTLPPITPSLNYFPIILLINIPILGVSVIMIYLNRKRFKKPQEDLDFL